LKTREVFSLAMQDSCGSGFTTVVITAVSAGCFIGGIEGARACFHMGSRQPADRAMAGMLAPPRHVAKFHGFWTSAVRLAGILDSPSYGPGDISSGDPPGAFLQYRCFSGVALDLRA
jgi:hypothetical protein